MADPEPAAEARGRFVVATRNPHKLREFAEILADFELLELPEGIELPPEEGATFAENAVVKAQAAHEATGLPAIADDSGIVAYGLGGRPGVFSARYAGESASDEENLGKLLSDLEGHSDRRAAYVCALALVGIGREPIVCEGRCEGELISDPRGEGGFGYDPAFVPEATGVGDRRTMAELDPAEKHSISHRGAAARLLAEDLKARARET